MRSLKNEEDLDSVADYFPQEAYEALFFLAAGFPLEEVFQEMEKSGEQQTIDTNDYKAALDNPDSKRRFFVVEGELDRLLRNSNFYKIENLISMSYRMKNG